MFTSQCHDHFREDFVFGCLGEIEISSAPSSSAALPTTHLLWIVPTVKIVDEENHSYLQQPLDPDYFQQQLQQQQPQQHDGAVMPIQPSLCGALAYSLHHGHHTATQKLRVGTFCDISKQLRQEDPDIDVLLGAQPSPLENVSRDSSTKFERVGKDRNVRRTLVVEKSSRRRSSSRETGFRRSFHQHRGQLLLLLPPSTSATRSSA